MGPDTVFHVPRKVLIDHGTRSARVERGDRLRDLPACHLGRLEDGYWSIAPLPSRVFEPTRSEPPSIANVDAAFRQNVTRNVTRFLSAIGLEAKAFKNTQEIR